MQFLSGVCSGLVWGWVFGACFLLLKGTHLEHQTKAFAERGPGTLGSQCLRSALFL